jgi:hypothetical protein
MRKEKERRSWKFVVLYLWIEWELAVMGTPTKVIL